MADNVTTVNLLPAVTEIQASDILYLVRGAGSDRDHSVTLELIKTWMSTLADVACSSINVTGGVSAAGTVNASSGKFNILAVTGSTSFPDGSVDGSAIADRTVTQGKIGVGAIGTNELADSVVYPKHIAKDNVFELKSVRAATPGKWTAADFVGAAFTAPYLVDDSTSSFGTNLSILLKGCPAGTTVNIVNNTGSSKTYGYVTTSGATSGYTVSVENQTVLSLFVLGVGTFGNSTVALIYPFSK